MSHSIPTEHDSEGVKKRDSNTTNSKDDENLLQNWSLTFTEYADQIVIKSVNQVEYNERKDDFKQRNVDGENTRDEPREFKTPATEFVPQPFKNIADQRNQVVLANKLGSKTSNKNKTEHGKDDNLQDFVVKKKLESGSDIPIMDESNNGINRSSKNNKRNIISGDDRLNRKHKVVKNDDNKNKARDTKDVQQTKCERNTEKRDIEKDERNEHISTQVQRLDVSKYLVLPQLNANGHEMDIGDQTSSQNSEFKNGIKPSQGNFNGGGGGRVQPIYLRLPGQSTGQMMFAEMDQEHGQVRIVGRDKDKEMLSRLAWLLLDAGTSALRTTFDSIHPPLSLREHLKQTHLKTVLKRLQQQGMLTDKQWKLLYPVKKGHSSSQRYDSRTLILLLETICHLCPPYPHGWTKEPLPKDGSLSADIVRLQLQFQEIARHEGIAGESFGSLWLQIRDVIIRLGGPPIRMKIARIETELINMEMQQHYIKTLRETWQPDMMQKLEKVHESRSKTSRTRKAYANIKGIEEGLSPEDRVTLKKTYKLLTENVNAEDVIDRLQQSQVIKFSDRQEILGASKKQERMQLLLEKITQSKLPYAVKALFDAMKFKYKKIYEHVMSVRKQTYKEGVVTTIDVAGITKEALINNYKTMLSRVYPFPWNDAVYGNIRDIYTPLDIVDSDGQKIHSTEMMPQACRNGRGNRIMLQGSHGSGKSFLCDWLAYMWATQPNFFKNGFDHLLYINMGNLVGNFETAVYKGLFPDNFKISIHEFWETLERDSRGVLLLIDDFDQSQCGELTDIVLGSRLRQCTVLLTVNPDYLVGSKFVPDITWFNLGFSDANIKRYFKTCVNLSQLEQEQFGKLFHLAGRESWLLRPYLANPMLAMTAFATFSTLRKGTMLKEMKTTCDLIDKFGVAMATLHCKKQKIDVIGFEFPDEISRAIKQLDEFAFTCLIDGRFQFTEQDILDSTNEPTVMKFGAFNKIAQGSKLKFSSGISMHFLAARHIANMVYDDIETILHTNKIIKLPKYAQLMSFICGQYRDDTDTTILQSLIELLASRNEYCIRGHNVAASTNGTPVEQMAYVSRGIITDFVTSLQCLAECPERDGVIKIIAQSFPQRLIVKDNVILSLKVIQGLCSVLRDPACAIEELEFEIHQYHYPMLPMFLQLATAIGYCRSVISIKITWSSLDTMSAFLAAVLEISESIKRVSLLEDHSKKPAKLVPASTWAALQSACNRLTSICSFSFLHVGMPSVVNHVLQHLPTCIPDISLSGCCFNLMCAGQIANYLHGNTSIRSLDISYTKLNSSEFVAIFQGMQMCEGIRSVRIRGIRLDRPCINALCEYIKLTHSLEILDMSDCKLNTEMCIRLVGAIKLNRTLMRLVFNNARITSEGRRVISNTNSMVQPINMEGLISTLV